jgi:hypothetical protein
MIISKIKKIEKENIFSLSAMVVVDDVVVLVWWLKQHHGLMRTHG